MTIDARRARLATLAAWASFFTYLWLAGASVRYLGARTQWVVPFGAVTLWAAVALVLRTPRSRAPLGPREGTGLLLLALPLAATLLVPHAELGAYAASHKSTTFFPAVKPAPPASPRDVNLLDIRIAEDDDTFALVSHIHPGTRVGLLGLVTQTEPREFSLTRFYITCCIADAQPLTLHVHWPHAVKRDRWVWVVGTLERDGKRYALAADRVTPRHAPTDPYLGFTG
jgi:uncharacterized repeat protein (TIGR03943 family)